MPRTSTILCVCATRRVPPPHRPCDGDSDASCSPPYHLAHPLPPRCALCRRTRDATLPPSACDRTGSASLVARRVSSSPRWYDERRARARSNAPSATTRHDGLGDARLRSSCSCDQWCAYRKVSSAPSAILPARSRATIADAVEDDAGDVLRQSTHSTAFDDACHAVQSTLSHYLRLFLTPSMSRSHAASACCCRNNAAKS